MRALTMASFVVGSGVLLACADTSFRNAPTAPVLSASTVQASSGHLVTGGVEINVNGESRQISFAAVRHQDGSVSGEYELNGLGTRIHADITCFNASLQSPISTFDNIAGIGGVVSQATDPAMVGADMAFIIKRTRDVMSPPHIFQGDPDVFCATPGALFDSGDFPLYPIVSGNVEIH